MGWEPCTRSQTDPRPSTHLSRVSPRGTGACQGRSGGLRLSFITAPARSHKSPRCSGGSLSIYPAPQAGFAAPLVPTPRHHQLRYVYTNAPTSAGRSSARLQRRPPLPALGDSPKPPQQQPQVPSAPSDPSVKASRGAGGHWWPCQP